MSLQRPDSQISRLRGGHWAVTGCTFLETRDGKNLGRLIVVEIMLKVVLILLRIEVGKIRFYQKKRKYLRRRNIFHTSVHDEI